MESRRYGLLLSYPHRFPHAADSRFRRNLEPLHH
jgi:hypothetical protein